MNLLIHKQGDTNKQIHTHKCEGVKKKEKEDNNTSLYRDDDDAVVSRVHR